MLTKEVLVAALDEENTPQFRKRFVLDRVEEVTEKVKLLVHRGVAGYVAEVLRSAVVRDVGSVRPVRIHGNLRQ
ncbi:MAG TPA: hypothetical protein VME23_12220 [Terracidiphilus sp.]|nr:hypothetical protein [Terracidiphilus sp.]